MRKLRKIEDECVEKTELVVKGGENADEFTRLKRRIGSDLNEAIKMIKERDELELTTSSSRHTVELSNNVRKKIKEAKVGADNLTELLKRDTEKLEKKNKSNPETEAQLENREELVGLIFQHIKEVEAFSLKKHGDGVYLAAGASNANRDVTISEIPNENDEGFQLLRRNDAILDKHLEDISESVGVLKEIALDMHKEGELQGILMDKINDKADDVNDQLENINIRMRKIIEKIRKGDRFCVDFILLCVILGIGGYIYSMVKS